MILLARPPSTALRPFIENLWYHQGITSDYAMERLLPDGAIELIIDLTPTPKHWIDSLAPGTIRSVRRSWMSGQHSRHIRIEAAMSSCMIGARFRPGGAHPFVSFPVSELNDSVIEAELFWGRAVMELRERLLETASAEERLRLLDSALLDLGRGRLEGDAALGHALRRLGGPVSIRSLAEEIGVSQKRLVWMFEEKVGLKPKSLARVLRFQRVLKRLERERRVSWSFLASEAGYFDQAHFIRDFEGFSGLRPSQYLVEKGDYLNFIPIR